MSVFNEVSATKVKVGLESKGDSLRSPQARKYFGTPSWRASGPPLDALGVLTWKLLHFLASLQPSAQEGRGNSQLDNARQLVRENQELISPSDLEITSEGFSVSMRGSTQGEDIDKVWGNRGSSKTVR